jgi:peptide-methionine (R)-S-oxide reductase
MPIYKITKTLEEWKELLTPEQFEVTRMHGTERPFSHPSCSIFSPGIYRCVCCKTPLFDSTRKFESGTGWPSFYEPIEQGAVEEKKDLSYGMVRTEVLCATCGAHLGHVFEDAPQTPTNKRYCINGIALEKVEKIDQNNQKVDK